MITFCPMDAVLQQASDYSAPVRFYPDEEWLLILAHFADRFRDGAGTRGHRNDWQVLNHTSGIGCTELDGFDPAEAGKQARRRLAKLFIQAGQNTEAGLLLWRCGIRTLADLEKPYRFSGRVPNWPLAWWANQVNRQFKKPWPNRSHPEARWVTHASLRYCTWRKTWGVAFFYNYLHDGGSSWNEGVAQHPGEGLKRFGERVSEFIEERFEPEDRNGPLYRPDRERQWQRVHEAMENLFPWGTHVSPDYAKQIADILADVSGGVLTCGRFQLTPQRLATLRRWARDAVKASAKEDRSAR